MIGSQYPCIPLSYSVFYTWNTQLLRTFENGLKNFLNFVWLNVKKKKKVECSFEIEDMF